MRRNLGTKNLKKWSEVTTVTPSTPINQGNHPRAIHVKMLIYSYLYSLLGVAMEPSEKVVYIRVPSHKFDGPME